MRRKKEEDEPFFSLAAMDEVVQVLKETRKRLADTLAELEKERTKHVTFMMQGGAVVMASEYDALKADYDALLAQVELSKAGTGNADK